jgi:hypothetical protein
MAVWDTLFGSPAPTGLNAGTFGTLGQGASDIFSGMAEGEKAQGARLEAQSYEAAAEFAGLEAQISKSTTSINTAQATRQGYQGIGRVQAGVAGAGFSGAGSGGDILRSSSQQAALQAGVASQTGQIATIGYQEQQKSYESMAQASEMAAKADETSSIGSYISGGVKIAGTIMMM